MICKLPELVVTHFEFVSAVGAVYDRALFFSSITSSRCYGKSCAVIDRAYSGRKFKVSHYRSRRMLDFSPKSMRYILSFGLFLMWFGISFAQVRRVDDA